MKRKRIILIVVVMLLLIAGAFLILKPVIENKKNMQEQEKILNAVEGGEALIDIEIVEGETEQDYYTSVDASSVIAPVPSKSPLIDEAVSQLNGLGIIEIGSIDLKLPIVEGVEAGALEVSVGHLFESADIGNEGNCIIVGHRNYTYGEMFNRLDELKAGEIIKISSIDGSEYKYKVYTTTVVEPGSEKLFECDDGQYKLTLLTCTPVRKATHRLLIMAELMS